MQEFSSISVSSYEAGLLADRLSQQSASGWEVVAIVPTGSTVTAYLSRAIGSQVAQPAAIVVAEPDPEPQAAQAVAEPPSNEIAPEPTQTDGGWAAGAAESSAVAAEVTPAVADEVMADEVISEPVLPTAAVVAEPTAAEPADASAAPAGWYADPSARFELRYWDGAQWTEHVSRSGQQYTDPPVA